MNVLKKCGLLFIGLLLSFSLKDNIYAHGFAMSYLYGGTTTQYQNYVEATGSALDAVSPDYLEINGDGSLKVVDKMDPAFISYMHSKNKQVIPFLTNHWDRDLGITALNNTDGLTTQIAKFVYDNQLDGINVDIENVTHLHKDAYTNFVKALRDKLPDKSISVAVAANPNNWQTGWHGCYDYTKLAEYANYLVVMGYDESFQGGPAGPVASSSFTERAVQYALTKTTPDKIVLAVPFFGRYWKNGAASGGIGITTMDIQNLTQNYETSKEYHADTQSAETILTIKSDDIPPKLWGGRTLDAGTYHIWYDDYNATKYKLDLVEQYKLMGSGSWALGQEVNSIWSMYETYKTGGTSPSVTPQPTETTNPSQTPAPKPSVVYSGHIQNLDWEKDFSKKDGQTSGTEGRSLRMEAFKIKLLNAPKGASISYQSHVQNLDWQKYVIGPTITGTTGRSLRLEAIRIKLNNMPGYHVEYRTHVQNKGWLGWVSDGELSGTTGKSLRMEAIQIRLVPDTVKTTAPGETSQESSDEVVEKGWFSKDEYHEDGLTTRAAAVKLLMRMATNLPDAFGSDFADTKEHKDREFLRKARYYGIIKGDEYNRFNPDAPITRRDLVLMMDQVFNLPDTVDFHINRAQDIDFTESSADAYYAINKYLELEIMDVDGNGNFRPQETLTMGEAANIAERMSGAGLRDPKHPEKILEPR